MLAGPGRVSGQVATSRQLHLGVQLATTNVTWSSLREAAQRAESLDYDSLWLPDHLIAREGDAPRLEAWEVLAALAAVTTRIHLGPLVTPVTFRHPALLAKMAATLDHISRGRAILGLGTGGMFEEHIQYGLRFGEPRERGERLEESAAIIRSLLDAQEPTTIRGNHYRLNAAIALPRPFQRRLPLLVAGTGRAVMRVAARHADMWNAISLPVIGFGEKIGVLRDHLRKNGRDDASLLPTVSFRVIVRDEPSGLEERIRQLDPAWREDPYRIEGRVGRVARELREYVRLGARGFIAQMPAPFDFETLERLAGELRGMVVDH